jgi:hypothetical protein
MSVAHDNLRVLTPAPRPAFAMIDKDDAAKARQLGLLFYATYHYLSELANNDGECWPSYNTIARELNVCRRTAINLVKGLREAGLLTTEHRVKSNGHASSNTIRVTNHPHRYGAADAPPPVHDLHHMVHGDAPRVVHGDAPSLEQETGEQETERDISSKSKKKTTTPTLTKVALERFERWYEHYPRKEARGAAEKAWKTLDPNDDQTEQMIAALSWQIPSNDWTRLNRSYTPLPATYLNAKRHLDVNPSAMPEQGSVNPNQDILDRLAAEVRELSQRPADPTNPNRRRF